MTGLEAGGKSKRAALISATLSCRHNLSPKDTQTADCRVPPSNNRRCKHMRTSAKGNWRRQVLAASVSGCRWWCC